jgi:hypothetical protein
LVGVSLDAPTVGVLALQGAVRRRLRQSVDPRRRHGRYPTMNFMVLIVVAITTWRRRAED